MDLLNGRSGRTELDWQLEGYLTALDRDLRSVTRLARSALAQGPSRPWMSETPRRGRGVADRLKGLRASRQIMPLQSQFTD